MIGILKTRVAPSAIAFALIYCASVFAQGPAEDAAADAGPVLETNPAVRAALEIPRKQPADYFQAVNWLIDLGRLELAKPILEELTKLQLTDVQRASLVDQFGSRSMLQLARTKELAPAGSEFADACMAAAATAANDPKRIATLLSQVADPSAEVRLMARNDLAATGQTGVIATLEALAQETNPARRDALVAAAAQMDPLVAGPLLAMLDTDDPALRAEVVTLLKKLRVQQANPLIAQPVESAERALATAIENYRRGSPPFTTDESNRVELWSWDDATKKLSATRYAAEDARILWMARLARELAQRRPDNEAYRRQALVLELEAAALDPATRKSSAIDPLGSADVAMVNQLLADALESNHVNAAVAAADALGQRGVADVLYMADAQPSALASALLHPNRRVRFAALGTIMALDPKSPYAGSSRVPEALAWFAGGTGERRALVAMPTNVAATNLAGMLAAHRLEAEATNRGREAVALARGMTDLEIILLDMDLDGLGIREAVYEMRMSPTTGDIPIALLAPDGRLEAAERLAEEHERVITVPRPHSAEVLGRVVEQLTNLAGRDAVPADERASQAVQAMTWLAKLASGERPFYKIRRTEPVIEAALYQATAAEPAIAALARLGTPESHRALVNFASQPALPIESRSQAAAAFRESVASHGVLLTGDEILTQYDRYNASAAADAETQQILGSLLDAIESRRDRDSPAPLPQP